MSCATQQLSMTRICPIIRWKISCHQLPTHMSSLFELNRDVNKKQVATRKIILYHDRLDMGPLLEWDLKVLPFVINWSDRAKECVRNENDEENCHGTRKLDAIYQFTKTVPMMLVPPAKKGASKKKIYQV